ncbi:MAG: DinB family protein [Chthonomonas sp.]|nr:DinB family protein [Chthonomonas sp.]
MPNAAILAAVDDSGYQLDQSLAGLSGADLDAKALPSMMSPREHMEHLYEVYHACIVMSQGGSHEWGSYTLPDDVKADIANRWRAKRDEAVAMIKGSDDPKVEEMACGFILQHDGYHVGQLCAHRIALDPGFNPYSIYRH